VHGENTQKWDSKLKKFVKIPHNSGGNSGGCQKAGEGFRAELTNTNGYCGMIGVEMENGRRENRFSMENVCEFGEYLVLRCVRVEQSDIVTVA
jgi:hypothetical protein